MQVEDLSLDYPEKCLLHARREMSVVRALSEVDERFGFAHQILDGVAPMQIVKSPRWLVACHSSHVASRSFAGWRAVGRYQY